MFLTAFTLYTVIAILIADAVASEVATHIVPRIRERSDILVKMGPYSVVLFGVYGLLSLIGYQAPHPAIVLMWAIINAVIIAIIEMGVDGIYEGNCFCRTVRHYLMCLPRTHAFFTKNNHYRTIV